MKIFGIEGTAWNASVSVFDSEKGIEKLLSDPYQPTKGGIHPREASEHIASSMPEIIEEVLEDEKEKDIDAVAFSRGPGLGPCLRVTASAARALSLRLDVPLIGVNHTVAHIEMGRYLSGFEDPVILDAAGANTLISTYSNGKYQILGETFDTGAGNALDKFARHADLSHPGGPKIEELASEVTEDRYVDLPYTVKGMDLAFSGLVNAAQEKLDEGKDLNAVAYSLQENMFSMLTEISERALSLTGKENLVTGGGVTRNSRLTEMLEKMCKERGAKFYSPDGKYLTDNAAMIAVTGWLMAEQDQTIKIEESKVKPRWRPDEIKIEWRGKEDKEGKDKDRTKERNSTMGAEATVDFREDRVIKKRLPKKYRCKPLDIKLRKKRTAREARLISEARKSGVPTPIVLDIDKRDFKITMEKIEGQELKDKKIKEKDLKEIADILSKLHSSGIAHGDLTTRNIIDSGEKLYLIDFGLSYKTWDIEDFGMDIHVLEETIKEEIEGKKMEGFWKNYMDYEEKRDKTKTKLEEIKERGRYL